MTLMYLTEKWDPGDTESETKFSMKYKESLKQDEGYVLDHVIFSFVMLSNM